MIIRLLGTAAGDGFPSQKCNCRGCRTAREQPSKAIPRAASSVAVSADGDHWFLLNAPPRIGPQIESYTPLLPKKELNTIEAVLVTDADPDHVLGFSQLQGGAAPVLYGPSGLSTALAEEPVFSKLAEKNLRIEFREVPYRPAPLLLKTQRSSGLLFCAFPLRVTRLSHIGARSASQAVTVGYRIQDVKTGGKLVFAPSLSSRDEAAQKQMEDCDALLLDGTFWDERETIGSSTGAIPALRATHWAAGGPEGSLEILRNLSCRYKIYIHVNHTNPILIEDSRERAEVREAGVEVGRDGMEFLI